MKEKLDFILKLFMSKVYKSREVLGERRGDWGTGGWGEKAGTGGINSGTDIEEKKRKICKISQGVGLMETEKR